MALRSDPADVQAARQALRTARHSSGRANGRTGRGQGRRSKYNAVATVVDGIRFDSKKEAKRYGELKMLELAGSIWDLERQPRFPLKVPSTTGTMSGAAKALAGTFDGLIGEYHGDFKYRDAVTVPYVVEDVKGFRTPLYRWKKRHVEAQYGIKIREV